MLIPGDTVVHNFTIPFDYDDVEEVDISYKQGDRIVYEKKITHQTSDVYITRGDGFTILSCDLSQNVTLLFEDNMTYTIQLTVLTSGGGRTTSGIIKSSSGIQYVRRPLPEGGVNNE
jgi:hypothetical protein